MMHGNCKCFHHIIAKILMALAWAAAVLFFVSGPSGIVWNMDADQYFQLVILFSLLLFGTVFCGCCRKNMMMHGGMSCPACEGKGGEHTHGHM